MPAGAVTFVRIVQAIAAFERTLISGGSAFDRYVFGGEHDGAAAERQARHGAVLLAACRLLGLPLRHQLRRQLARRAGGRPGAASFAVDGTSVRPMRVPTLRNVALTAPYMHDGRFATLEAVLGALLAARRPGARGMSLDPRLPRTALTADERAELVAFLDSLTDPAFVSRFAAPDEPRRDGRRG